MRVGVAYATDFGQLSAGGILSYIRSVGRFADEDTDVLYVGIGRLAGELPRSRDSFLSVKPEISGNGSLNAAFLKALISHRASLNSLDALIVHRAEHMLLPLTTPRLLMLHGGTLFALRAQRSMFGLAYAPLEAVARLKARRTLSVIPNHTLGHAGRLLSKPITATTCFDERVFRPSPREVEKRIIFAGRLVPEKQIEHVLRASAALRWPVTIVGSGPEEMRLKLLAATLKVDATFTGALSSRAVAELYRDSPGVFVMTSKFEGFPVALLEAAACGLPVAGLATPGLGDAIARLGGHLAASRHELGHAILRAHAQGNRLPLAELRDTFCTPSVASDFWRHVRQAAEG